VVFDGTVPSLVGQIHAHYSNSICIGARATLRNGTCGALTFRCSTELTDFLADLDAADDEKRTDDQHQLHTARFKATTTGAATSVVFDGTVPSLVGQLLNARWLSVGGLNAYRTRHHVYHEPEVWAQVAKTSHGLGVVTSTSYKLGYTDGTNADGDMKAIELAAKEVDKLAKILVGKALGIKKGSGSYRNGSFKQQWIAFLKSTAK
jgi:hypothetical protein